MRRGQRIAWVAVLGTAGLAAAPAVAAPAAGGGREAASRVATSSAASAAETGAARRLGNGPIVFATGFSLPPGPDFSVPGDIYRVNPDGTGEQQLTHDSGDSTGAGSPSVSPDGRRIAYVSNVSGRFDVWMMNVDGTSQYVFKSTPGVDYAFPVWSPDGRHLAVTACRSLLDVVTWCDLDVMRGDGSREHVLLGGHRNHLAPAYSPDGRWITFHSDRVGLLSAVWVVHPDGSGLHRLTPADREASLARWSPGGRQIVFTTECCRADSNVWVMRSDGSRERQLSRAVYPHQAGSATYSPDGRQIVFVSDLFRAAGAGNDLLVMRSDGTHVRRIVSDVPDVFWTAWAPQPAAYDALSLGGQS